MSERFDVCLIGLKCYDLLARKPVPRYLGGIERILVAFARTLHSKGVKVAFITYDEGQVEEEVLDGITIIKAHKANAGIPVVRVIHPGMTAIWRAMKSADARIYVEMGAGVETLATTMGIRKINSGRAQAIFCAASNMDCEKELSGITTLHERLLYRRALRMVDKVVCQTQTQAQMMRENHQIESSVIPMPFEAPDDNEAKLQGTYSEYRSPPAGFDLLWVGRTVEVKRLEWYLDLAERMPAATFHIAGSANQSSDYASAQLMRAQGLKNVVLHGRVSDEELNNLYQKAFALCCTSIIEGFPTTFMEAWKIGLPLVTTFDPDGIVAKSGAGFSASSIDGLEQALNRLHENSSSYIEASKLSLLLYQQQFSPEAIIGQYLALFDIQ